MGDVPIACTLTATELDDRVEEWRQVLGRSVSGAERHSPLELRLALSDGPADIGTLAQLAQYFSNNPLVQERLRIEKYLQIPKAPATQRDYIYSRIKSIFFFTIIIF